MEQLNRLLLMAEDELTEYSTTARKIEKLRRKIGLSVSAAEQKQTIAALKDSMQSDWIRRIVEQQRQTVALPFWGIAGLGLLVGISFSQPLGLVASMGGAIAAYRVQKWGWQLQAKRLLMQTFTEIEARQ
ncbi:hypothetical protein [Chlorogloea sp. CCALA 695]|uniref:hypothetical protein n=1 Tax=Chlorogloea sp. CCALA 695 TaxID=2107693 RepID=UPI000D084140|nr:hypothetical protein [Chlorogloea sp. CCALA 695]PSB33835.1 hypothetical protein C7B70_05950 [Chlorogloea sp. CCALA 695]